MRVDGGHDFLRFFPECDGAIDARFAFAAKTPFGCRHIGWKYTEKRIAVVCIAKCVLQKCEQLCGGLERRVERLESFERVAQPLARNSKSVEAELVAPLEPRGQAPNLAKARLQHAFYHGLEAASVAQIYALGFHQGMLTREAGSREPAARSLRGAALALTQLVEEWSRDRELRRVHTVFEQVSYDRRIARGVGRGRRVLDAT